MTTKGVSFQPSPGGQFSAVVDTEDRPEATALRDRVANLQPPIDTDLSQESRPPIDSSGWAEKP